MLHVFVAVNATLEVVDIAQGSTTIPPVAVKNAFACYPLSQGSVPLQTGDVIDGKYRIVRIIGEDPTRVETGEE